jgi:hypothetical protein
MSAGGMFLLRDGELVELTDQPYDSEDLLQKLLAEHPSLMAGSQIDPVAPRRWLLVSREVGVPSEEDGGRRWSLDHLFLDQDGVPTLVEVKRSTDGRIRREVVGQMLDYAANAVVHWPVEHIRGSFEARCEAAGLEPAAELCALLDGDADAEAFWSRVRVNLQAGRVRLIFVADVIPPELRRVVEFLNTQMDPAEVLAVEIKQYVGEGLRTLVPRAIGQTVEAQRRKSAGEGEGRAWDEASFFEAVEARNGMAVAGAARALFDWAKTLGRVWFGSGKRSGSFGLAVPVDGRDRYLFAAYTYGTVEIYFQWLKNSPPFDDEVKRRELLDRLNAIEGIDLPADSVGRRPSVRLAALLRPDLMQRFTAALAWAASERRALGAGGAVARAGD